MFKICAYWLRSGTDQSEKLLVIMDLHGWTYVTSWKKSLFKTIISILVQLNILSFSFKNSLWKHTIGYIPLDLINFDCYIFSFCDELGLLCLSSRESHKCPSLLYCKDEKTTQVSSKDQLNFGTYFHILRWSSRPLFESLIQEEMARLFPVITWVADGWCIFSVFLNATSQGLNNLSRNKKSRKH